MPVDGRNDPEQPYHLFDNKLDLFALYCTDVDNVRILKIGIKRLHAHLCRIGKEDPDYNKIFKQYSSATHQLNSIKILLN